MNGNISQIIIDKFSNKFTAAYKGLTGYGKPKILKYGPVIFKRWYYSTLIDETTLSPSFIYGASLGVNSGVSSLSVRTEMSGSSFKGFSVIENRYSINSHPVVKDLRVLVDFCSPDVDLDEQNRIIPAIAERINKFLSQGDPFYVEFLTAVAFELKLLKKADAIYSNKATISNNYTSFIKLNQEEALKKIVDCTVRLCSKNINGALPQPVSFISEKGVIALIKKPVSIDEIYKKIFLSFGVDIEQLWLDYNENGADAGEEQSAMLSSTFYLGVILDKWFITPFGEFLKLIEPIYSFCYNFDEELAYLHDVIKSDGSVETALFSPCAFYSFTPFGRIFFAVDTVAEKKKRPVIPVSELLGLLNYEAAPAKSPMHNKVLEAREVYSFKAKLFEDKRFWKNIDAAEYNTLHELHMEIALNFGFGLSRYSFFTDVNFNPFCEFICPKSKGKQRKANKVTLEELDLVKGKKLIYISDTGRKIEIELIKRFAAENKNKTAHYPKTVKISKSLLNKDSESD